MPLGWAPLRPNIEYLLRYKTAYAIKEWILWSHFDEGECPEWFNPEQHRLGVAVIGSGVRKAPWAEFAVKEIAAWVSLWSHATDEMWRARDKRLTFIGPEMLKKPDYYSGEFPFQNSCYFGGGLLFLPGVDMDDRTMFFRAGLTIAAQEREQGQTLVSFFADNPGDAEERLHREFEGEFAILVP